MEKREETFLLITQKGSTREVQSKDTTIAVKSKRRDNFTSNLDNQREGNPGVFSKETMTLFNRAKGREIQKIHSQ